MFQKSKQKKFNIQKNTLEKKRLKKGTNLLKQFFFVFRKQAYFVDLFVRVTNKIAIKMYQQLGYVVYRTVLEYYSGDPDEDAYGKFSFFFFFSKFETTKNNKQILFCIFSDMRKALSRDDKKKSMIPLSHPVRPEEVD